MFSQSEDVLSTDRIKERNRNDTQKLNRWKLCAGEMFFNWYIFLVSLNKGNLVWGWGRVRCCGVGMR